MDYDVIIVGGGASGVFMSYELTKLNTAARVLMLEKGGDLASRVCPISNNKTKTCIHCSPCSIMNGFGGAGTLSDGKYNITNAFGGELHKCVGADTAL
ncbi:MAG TPA: NAD(P)-binding protein, partial [Clostridiales bacterium]|nr:NAD(P)-binding protein [Clostridiales bacterium]